MDELAVSSAELVRALQFIRTHLYAAQVQISPGDDKIIVRHIDEAYGCARDICNAINTHGIQNCN